MNSRDITEILNKIDEMRAVFVLGQRAVPFLEEVFFFLKEISPLMDEINSSIRESTATMPRATSQLQSVSEATELATTEIMDLVDAVLAQLSPMEKSLEEIAGNVAVVESSRIRINDALKAAYARLGEEIPPDVSRALTAQSNALSSTNDRLSKLPELTGIRAMVNRIMISLQVQDITAQQIASVNHLIESIREKMNALVERLGCTPLTVADDAWPIYSNSNFDPHARYERGDDRQSMIDRVMEDGIDGTESPIKTVKPAVAKSSTDAPNVANGPASQSEIDALFQNGFSA